MKSITTLCLFTAILGVATAGDFTNKGPLSPREEQLTFRVLDGFQVTLAASEPNIVDPVAMAFDERGRLFVVEMRAYPNEGIGTGKITSGRIKLLTDADGDGFFEKAVTYADGLRLPTSVMPYKDGVIVANPPEILFLRDTNDDGRADESRVLYTGFGLGNIQQMINGFQWGLDNWVYGSAGNNGGTIRSPENPKMPPVVLRGRGVRFHPDKPGSLEPTSGGGQFGITPDDWGQWFTATNSQHLRHIVLPDHYLRRNPLLPVSSVTINIPDHGSSCKVFRRSPFEAWRVERTNRRKKGPLGKRLPSTELVPGGFITSACSPLVYRADLFPKEFYGNTLVCDPANNLIHRDLLVANGATFIAKRADSGCEFLTSTDNWFRPVFLTIGPDGAVYVADFYREAIETPLSLPDDIKKKLNLQSRNRGRIWRIAPKGSKPGRLPNLAKKSSQVLATYLVHPNAWLRHTAQRLLVQRKDTDAVPHLQTLARTAKFAPGRAHALWTLDALGALKENDIATALRDTSAGVREQALRLADRRLESKTLQAAAVKLADDPSFRVRLQLAFTLGHADSPAVTAALAKIVNRDYADKWMRTAILSSSRRIAADLLAQLVRDAKNPNVYAPMVQKLAMLTASGYEKENLLRAFQMLATKAGAPPAAWQIALLDGLGEGLNNRGQSLANWWSGAPLGLTDALLKTRPFFKNAAKTALDASKPASSRLAGIRLLRYAAFEEASGALEKLLSPLQPRDLQMAAVQTLSAHSHDGVGKLLLKEWGGYSPTVRREVIEALFARPDRIGQLLDAVEAKSVLPGHLEPPRVQQLRKHPNAKLRQRATKLLAGIATPKRDMIVQLHQPVLKMDGDAQKGRIVFRKTCATCHRLENFGNEVGADLQAALGNKTPAALLIDVLDPSREVDPRFVEYVVITKNGKVASGLIASETSTSITLRRAEKVEETFIRSQIATIQATTKSLMPEGLEKQLDRRALADLLAYLMSVVKR